MLTVWAALHIHASRACLAVITLLSWKFSEVDISWSLVLLFHRQIYFVALVDQHLVLVLRLLQLCLKDLQLPVNSGDFALLLVKYGLKLFFQLPFRLFEFFFSILHNTVLFLFKLFNAFIQHLYMKLELLFHLNVISNIFLILLHLELGFFWRQVDAFESRR